MDNYRALCRKRISYIDRIVRFLRHALCDLLFLLFILNYSPIDLLISRYLDSIGLKVEGIIAYNTKVTIGIFSPTSCWRFGLVYSSQLWIGRSWVGVPKWCWYAPQLISPGRLQRLPHLFLSTDELSLGSFSASLTSMLAFGLEDPSAVFWPPKGCGDNSDIGCWISSGIKVELGVNTNSSNCEYSPLDI